MDANEKFIKIFKRGYSKDLSEYRNRIDRVNHIWI